jgi:hypothetical protein
VIVLVCAIGGALMLMLWQLARRPSPVRQ